MERRVIEIDDESCIGCGKCVATCPNGAIGMINRKALLLRDEYCDGLGKCIPVCPTQAIHFIVRDADPFNEAAVNRHLTAIHPDRARVRRSRTSVQKSVPKRDRTQWPLQLQFISPDAPFLKDADILLIADCAPVAYGPDFEADFVRDRALLIACPRQKSADYAKILTDIFYQNDINSVTIVRMDETACAGLETDVSAALDSSGKTIPVEVVTLAGDGSVKSRADS